MLSVKTAAEKAGVSPSLVYAWCHEGRLPHKRLGRAGRRGAIRIEEGDLLAFLNACQGGKRNAGPLVLNHINLS